MKDVHGHAIRDYYQEKNPSPLILHTCYGDPEEMPVEVFFRDELDFSMIEHLALLESKGKVLDIGAGAGAHTLALEAMGFDVYGIDVSPACIEVMKESGVTNPILGDYRKHQGKYDTLLLMMNGIGIIGTLEAFPAFLKTCKSLLNPGGQILFDSSDISYLYEDGLMKPDRYYGEVKFQYEYKGEKGDWFDWVYIDQSTLMKMAEKEGCQVEILTTDENDQYLAQITF